MFKSNKWFVKITVRDLKTKELKDIGINIGVPFDLRYDVDKPILYGDFYDLNENPITGPFEIVSADKYTDPHEIKYKLNHLVWTSPSIRKHNHEVLKRMAPKIKEVLDD